MKQLIMKLIQHNKKELSCALISILVPVLFGLWSIVFIGGWLLLLVFVLGINSMKTRCFVIALVITLVLQVPYSESHIMTEIQPDITTDTIYKIDTAYNRIACDSVRTTIYNKILIDNTIVRNRINITGIAVYGITSSDTSVFTTLIHKRDSTYIKHDILLGCKDTTTIVERIPYTDRNFSFQKITKTFISDSSWNTVTHVELKNKSPNVDIRDYINLLRHSFANFTHTKLKISYVVMFVDSKDSNFVDTESDANDLIKSSCKDKATILGKFVYSEYDGCKNNATISTLHTYPRSRCGVSSPKLSYDRGVTAPYPDNCNWVSAEWTW